MNGTLRVSPTQRVVEARDALDRSDRTLLLAVAEARKAGESWATVGSILGISRQAAQQRFGRRIEAL